MATWLGLVTPSSRWEDRLEMLCPRPGNTQRCSGGARAPTLLLTWHLRSFLTRGLALRDPSPDWKEAHLELRPPQESQTLASPSLRCLQCAGRGLGADETTAFLPAARKVSCSPS